MIGYSIYSLMYESHKSWYSYVLNTLVGFVFVVLAYTGSRFVLEVILQRG